MTTRYRSALTSPMLASEKDETQFYFHPINTIHEVLNSAELQKFQLSILNEMLNAQNSLAEQFE